MSSLRFARVLLALGSITLSHTDVSHAAVPPAPLPRAWPGPAAVHSVDVRGTFGGNLSGLAYQPKTDRSPAVLWAVRNRPSTLFALRWDGAAWLPDAASSWTLHYPNGAGEPDAEGLTLASYAEPAVYIVAERDDRASAVSRSSVLRFDTSRPSGDSAATHEWDLTGDLPPVAANLGLEGIAYCPDAVLVAQGFRDESTGRAYDPADYPNHGGGLFFVGLEATGMIYVYALDHVGSGYRRIASFSSGHSTVVDLAFDRDAGRLWAQCDDGCQNQIHVLDIERFSIRERLARPTGMPNLNNEGIAFAPVSECEAGFRAFFWSDDAATDQHAIRAGALSCPM